MYGPCIRYTAGTLAVYIHSRVHVTCTHTRMHTGRGPYTYTAVYTVVYAVVYTPCTWPIHDREHGLYTAVLLYTVIYKYYTARTRNSPTEFAPFSQTVVITSLNQAKHHTACHRKFIKYGVKRDLGSRFFTYVRALSNHLRTGLKFNQKVGDYPQIQGRSYI